MKQADTWSCAAVCACMATGKSLEDFVAFTGHNGSEVSGNPGHPEGRKGFSNKEIARFLLENDLLEGSGFTMGKEEMKYLPDILCSFDFSLEGMRAFVNVKSERLVSPETGDPVTHTIFWDGETLWDPNPSALDGRPWKDYDVISLFLLTEMS